MCLHLDNRGYGDTLVMLAKSVQTPAVPHKFAYSIKDLVELTPLSRSQAYVEMRSGRLSASKIGGRTVILHEDLIAWLRRLPRKPVGASQR